MKFHLLEPLREDTHEAMVRVIKQRLGQWMTQVRSVGLSPDEHIVSELFEETEEDSFGNVKSRFYRGHIFISEEALAKIKQ